MIFGIGLFLAIAVTCILTFVWILVSQGLKDCIYDDDEFRGLVATIIISGIVGIIVAGVSCDRMIVNKTNDEIGIERDGDKLELENN